MNVLDKLGMQSEGTAQHPVHGYDVAMFGIDPDAVPGVAPGPNH